MSSEEEPDEPKAPGVAGAIQAAVNSKPISALLTPPAEVFGEYFRQRAAAKVAEWEDKKRENIREHQRRIQRVAAKALPDDPTETQAKLAFEWAERAQDIDPEIDPEVAALWEALLVQIATNSPRARRSMIALKQLEPEDAVRLLDTSKRGFGILSDSKATRDRFRSAGMIESRWKIRRPRVFILIAIMSLFIIGTTGSMLYIWRWINDDVVEDFIWRSARLLAVPFSNVPMSVLLLLFTFLFWAAFAIDEGFGMYRLTALGSDLRNQGLRLRDAVKDE